MSEALSIRRCVLSGCPVIAVAGRINRISGGRLQDEVCAVAVGTPVVVVDLAEVSAIDLPGVGMVVSCAEIVDELGGQLRLAPGPLVRWAVTSTGVMAELRAYPSVTAALNADSAGLRRSGRCEAM